MPLADALPVLDQSDVPSGCRRVWAPDGGLDWRLVEPGCERQCRWSDKGVRCTAMSVVTLRRGRARQLWHYCADHLFARVVVDGVFYVAVLRPVDGDNFAGSPGVGGAAEGVRNSSSAAAPRPSTAPRGR